VGVVYRKTLYWELPVAHGDPYGIGDIIDLGFALLVLLVAGVTAVIGIATAVVPACVLGDCFEDCGWRCQFEAVFVTAVGTWFQARPDRAVYGHLNQRRSILNFDSTLEVRLATDERREHHCPEHGPGPVWRGPKLRIF